MRAPPEPLRVQAVTTAAELTSLGPAWARLWERSTAAGPFQHPDWLLPWWRHLGGGELWSLAAWQGSELAGFAPFYIHTHARTGNRQVTLMGNGISDTLDVICDDAVPGAAHALAGYLHEHASSHWQSCDFRQLPGSSILLRSRLLQSSCERFETHCVADAPCPVLDLLQAQSGLAGTAPAKLLANLRNRRRRADALGSVQFERAEAESLTAALAALFRLHDMRWSSRDGGVLGGPEIRAFHREVTGNFLRRGWLRLYVLEVGSRSAAVNYGFFCRGRAYSYIGGFDPDLVKVSPGALVMRHAIEDAVREHAGEFDFLRGAEAYKYAWGARDRPHYRVRLAPRPFRHPARCDRRV